MKHFKGLQQDEVVIYFQLETRDRTTETGRKKSCKRENLQIFNT